MKFTIFSLLLAVAVAVCNGANETNTTAPSPAPKVDNTCNAKKCIKNDLMTGGKDQADPYCCAGIAGTKCDDGYHYSVGDDCYQGIAFSTCCTKDPVPGKFDYSKCTESKCTSPGLTGTDCYAGTKAEGCSCSDGYAAKETGATTVHTDGKTYFGYVCCPPGTEDTDGLSCGAHAAAAVPFGAVTMAATTVVAAVAIFF